MYSPHGKLSPEGLKPTSIVKKTLNISNFKSGFLRPPGLDRLSVRLKSPPHNHIPYLLQWPTPWRPTPRELIALPVIELS